MDELQEERVRRFRAASGFAGRFGPDTPERKAVNKWITTGEVTPHLPKEYHTPWKPPRPGAIASRSRQRATQQVQQADPLEPLIRQLALLNRLVSRLEFEWMGPGSAIRDK